MTIFVVQGHTHTHKTVISGSWIWLAESLFQWCNILVKTELQSFHRLYLWCQVLRWAKASKRESMGWGHRKKNSNSSMALRKVWTQEMEHNCSEQINMQTACIYIYIYAFSRRFYPKRLTVHSGYTLFFLPVCVFPGKWTHDLLRC